MNISKNKSNNIIDKYFMAYNIIISNIKDNNITKALEQIKTYLGAKDVVLYRLDDKGKFAFYENTGIVTCNYDDLCTLLNRYEKIIKGNNLSDIYYAPIELANSNFGLLVIHDPLNKVLNENELVEIFTEALGVLLESKENLAELKKISEEDVLTGVKNRRAYNKKIKEVEKNDLSFTYAILDLFRLKYVNDNYGHGAGDIYIKASIEIIEKYFPSSANGFHFSTELDEDKTKNFIYRFGGDEFIIISYLPEDVVKEKLELAAKEIENMNIGVFLNIPTGLNYGISSRNNLEPVEEVYKKADKNLSLDKQEMYLRRRINRRQ